VARKFPDAGAKPAKFDPRPLAVCYYRPLSGAGLKIPLGYADAVPKDVWVKGAPLAARAP